MEYLGNKKIVVFEGISGAGKTTIINEIIRKNIYAKYGIYNWFSKDSFRYIASNIHLYINNMQKSTYSIIYALEYLAKMDEIRKDEDKVALMHRYVYTPLAHETVRGINKELLDFLYNNSYFIEPYRVIFIEIDPEIAYYRIKKKGDQVIMNVVWMLYFQMK